MTKPKSVSTKTEEILVPKSLLSVRYNRVTTPLIWWLIATWNRDFTQWAMIHDDHFKKIASNDEVRSDVRKFLEVNGYIKIRKITTKNGEIKNLRIRGWASQSYQIIDRNEELVPYKIKDECFEKAHPRYTQDEPACLLTRKNLDLLERIPDKKPLLAEKKLGILHDHQSMQTLTRKTGRVNRGQKVDRVYSPWANASNRVRQCFTLAGEGIVGLDLRASQVALLAARYNDTSLVEDCEADKFYNGLANELEVPRKAAKQIFYKYYFGKNELRDKAARKVLDWMKNRYPTTAKKIFEEKQRCHKKFACDLQNREAAIFIDGIYLELGKMNIPVLTAHDAIYVGESNVEKAEKVMHEHLKKIEGLTKYHLKKESITHNTNIQHNTQAGTILCLPVSQT